MSNKKDVLQVYQENKKNKNGFPEEIFRKPAPVARDGLEPSTS